MQVGFATKIKELGGMKVLGRTIYARNLWRIIDKFHTLPTPERGLIPGITTTQMEYILEEMKIDQEERERLEKGVDANNAKQFFDNESDWWENPASEPFADDPQSDEDFSRELGEFLDNDSKAKMLTQMEGLANMDDIDETQEAKVQEEYNKRWEAVTKLLEGGNESIRAYRQNLHKKDAGANNGTLEDDSHQTLKPVDLSDNESEQAKLAKKALENTKKAIQGGYFN